MQSYSEHELRQRIDSALEIVRTVLENNRNPQIPSDVPHSYADKFHLAEFLTTTSLGCQLNMLEALGLNEDALRTLKKWSVTRSVSLRLIADSTCTYNRSETKNVESPVEHVTEVSTFGKLKAKITDKFVTKETRYYWDYKANYELFAYQGTNTNDKIVLKTRSCSLELTTSSEHSPKSSSSSISPIDLNITWLLQHLSDDLQLNFSIDRTVASCHTPRRNAQTERALQYHSTLYNFAQQVGNYFTGNLFPVHVNHKLDLGSLNSGRLFVPVLPVFEEPNIPKLPPGASDGSSLIRVKEERTPEGPQVTLSFGDFALLLNEQKRSIIEKFVELEKLFPENEGLISVQEAKIVVLLLHCKDICNLFSSGSDFIEQMLRNQLIAAIGKEVTPVDFNNYMVFHNRKLFKPEYEPQKFCYAIRRPDHYPEGIISIEANQADGSISEPIPTIVRQYTPENPITFCLDAATNVEIKGDRYLHATIAHHFRGYSGSQMNLVARARQFSSFILMVGKIIADDEFEPYAAIIIKNKDELKIPLMFEQIPTPKQFNDAIESLSPEQQNFAKAFRSLQLEATLFGVCIIQIKPQLEKLLKLPNDSLTKEIQLTEDLQELFITYQIPPDLISYEGNPDASAEQKLATVKRHVLAMQEMIKKSKEKQLEEQKQRKEYARAEAGLSPSDKVILVTRRFSPNSKPKFVVPNMPSQPPKKVGIVSGNKPVEYEASEEFDLTEVPKELDNQFDRFDEDHCLHPTIIKSADTWQKTFLPALLAQSRSQTMHQDEQGQEFNRAYDLLDAISKSGALSIDEASLHVVVAATHCFADTLMNTVIQQNVNPIEKVERSTLIIASTIHRTAPANLIKPELTERVQASSPNLFLQEL